MPFLLDLNPSFLSALTTILRAEDVDVIHTSHGVCAAAVLARVLSPATTVTYAAQNVEAEHARDFVDPELPVYKRLLGPRLIPLIERATVRCADLVTTVSEKDREAFVDRYGVSPDRIETIPTGAQSISASELESPAIVRERLGLDSDRPVAVFHGSYAHPPNEEAVTLIVDEIAPALRDRGVDIQFLLLGKEVPAVDSDDIVVPGFVEDLHSVLHAADLAVVPIRHGGGTKTKMFDYISVALPIVTTTKGAEGIDLIDGEHAYITADVDETFLECIARLAAEPELQAELETALRSLADRLTWDRSVERIAAFYDGKA